MQELTIVHFINQFFAGIGGEEKADTPVGVRDEATGPGKGLQLQLPQGYKIVATVFCGDNYFNDHAEEAKRQILEAVRVRVPQLFIAGPAFGAGRYGVACAEVCNMVAKELDVPCITAMYEENPGVDIYRDYKNLKVFILPTSATVAGMQDALTAMGHFAAKIASGATIGSAVKEGYIARGVRPVVLGDKTGVERAVDMLLAKVAGKAYATEVPFKQLEPVTPAPAIPNLSQATIAIANTAGIVPYGNPDGFKRYRNTQWRKYPIEGLNRLERGKWEAVHGGYDTRFQNDNPNYGVPLDAMRELEKEKAFNKLHPYLYVTPGVQASVKVMQQIGREMAQDMKDSGVNAVIMVST